MIGHIGSRYKSVENQQGRMSIKKNVGGRDRLVRGLLAVVLTVVAVSRLKRGKRKAGVLAAVGALGFGFNATTCYCGTNEALGVDTTDE